MHEIVGGWLGAQPNMDREVERTVVYQRRAPENSSYSVFEVSTSLTPDISNITS